jgi:hypothetical protein
LKIDTLPCTSRAENVKPVGTLKGGNAQLFHLSPSHVYFEFDKIPDPQLCIRRYGPGDLHTGLHVIDWDDTGESGDRAPTQLVLIHVCRALLLFRHNGQHLTHPHPSPRRTASLRGCHRVKHMCDQGRKLCVFGCTYRIFFVTPAIK